MITTINRSGVVNVLRDLFLSDTTILYGTSKLVQAITSNATEFIQAKLTNNKPYKLFIICEDKQTIEVGSQISKCRYTVGYRIDGLAVNPETVKETIDKIDDRLGKLLNNQMHAGLYFTSFYSDTSNRIIDIEYDNSGLFVEDRNNKVIAECSGAIGVMVYEYS